MICPCKDCPDKGCGSYHDQCEKYLAYKAENEKRRNKKQQAGIVDDLNFSAHGKVNLRAKQEGR